MIKVVTSATVWNDAIGKRISVTYAEVDETTGKVIADNKRVDRIVTEKEIVTCINTLLDYGDTIINSEA